MACRRVNLAGGALARVTGYLECRTLYAGPDTFLPERALLIDASVNRHAVLRFEDVWWQPYLWKQRHVKRRRIQRESHT